MTSSNYNCVLKGPPTQYIRWTSTGLLILTAYNDRAATDIHTQSWYPVSSQRHLPTLKVVVSDSSIQFSSSKHENSAIWTRARYPILRSMSAVWAGFDAYTNIFSYEAPRIRSGQYLAILRASYLSWVSCYPHRFTGLEYRRNQRDIKTFLSSLIDRPRHKTFLHSSSTFMHQRPILLSNLCSRS
jgi:hypothetical protein